MSILPLQGHLVLFYGDSKSFNKGGSTFAPLPIFRGVESFVFRYCEAAKAKTETLRTDDAIFDIWTDFAVGGEQLRAFTPHLAAAPSEELQQLAADGVQLLHKGEELISYIARARVTMPKTTREYVNNCERFAELALARLHIVPM